MAIHCEFWRCRNDWLLLDLRQRKIPGGADLVLVVVPVAIRLAFGPQHPCRLIECALFESTNQKIALDPVAGGASELLQSSSFCIESQVDEAVGIREFAASYRNLRPLSLFTMRQVQHRYRLDLYLPGPLGDVIMVQALGAAANYGRHLILALLAASRLDIQTEHHRRWQRR